MFLTFRSTWSTFLEKYVLENRCCFAFIKPWLFNWLLGFIFQRKHGRLGVIFEKWQKKCAYTRESTRFQWAEGAVWTGEMRGWGRVWGRWEKIGGGGGIAMFLLAAGTLRNCTMPGNWYQKELCTHVSQFCGKKKNDNLMFKHMQ